jgi:hypothetical protein
LTLDAYPARVDARLVEGVATRESARRDAADGYTVFRRYGFEGDTSSWTVQAPPPGSPPANGSNFAISTELIGVAASVTTEDTVLFGHGIEALATPDERADVLGRAIKHLLREGASR